MNIEEIEIEMKQWALSWRGEDMAWWAEKYGAKLVAVAKAVKNRIEWSKIDCPYCTLSNKEDAGNVPCYCNDQMDALKQEEIALRELEE